MWVRILVKLAFQRNQPFLERLVLERFPTIRARLKKEVVTTLLDGHTSVSSALASIESNHNRPESISAAISEYNTFLQSLTSRDSTRVASCIDSILPTGRQCNPYYIDEFLAIADETTLEESLDVLIDKIYSHGDEEDGEAEFEPAVELLTLHSSKGLTRRYVILPGLEHCWLPGDATGADLEERKRLFLVGITRATEFLLITYPRTRARGDSLNYAAAGRSQLSEFANHLGVTVERL
jgi:superfamily I DNA/RNA helicase